MANLLKDDGFKLVYYDAAAVVLLKNSPENRAVIREYPVDFSRTGPAAPPGVSFGLEPLAKLLRGFVDGRGFPMAEYNLGNFYESLGQVELAREQFERGIRLFPGYKMMRYCLGNLYFRSGRLAEALEAYGEILRFDSKDDKVFKVRGDIFLRQNDFAGAAREYERALELAPDSDAGVYKTLGLISLFHFHDPGKARDYFAKYLRRVRGPRESREIEGLLRAGGSRG